MNCLFCKIINKDVPSKIVYEDDIVMVIMDIYPSVDGHVLVIPKKHYTDIFELDDDTLLHINKIAKDITNLLLKKLNETSMTWSVNYGDRQEIKHYHLHLLPNYGKNKAKKDIEKIYELLKA